MNYDWVASADLENQQDVRSRYEEVSCHIVLDK